MADISSRTHKHNNVNVSVLSGKTTLDGFISEKSKYSLTSGKIASLNAGGGELYTNVTSGSLTLGCAEKITGIDAKVASGKAHISAPKDTGARVAYSVASGSIKIGLDGRNENLQEAAVFHTEMPKQMLMSTLQAEALFLIHTHFRNDSKGYKPITK